MEITAYECEECHAIFRSLDKYDNHITKHEYVENFTIKYPIPSQPIHRDNEWLEDIFAVDGTGPYEELYNRLYRYCTYCEMEFPDLNAYINHKCEGEVS